MVAGLIALLVLLALSIYALICHRQLSDETGEKAEECEPTHQQHAAQQRGSALGEEDGTQVRRRQPRQRDDAQVEVMHRDCLAPTGPDALERRPKRARPPQRGRQGEEAVVALDRLRRAAAATLLQAAQRGRLARRRYDLAWRHARRRTEWRSCPARSAAAAPAGAEEAPPPSTAALAAGGGARGGGAAALAGGGGCVALSRGLAGAAAGGAEAEAEAEAEQPMLRERSTEPHRLGAELVGRAAVEAEASPRHEADGRSDGRSDGMRSEAPVPAASLAAAEVAEAAEAAEAAAAAVAEAAVAEAAVAEAAVAATVAGPAASVCTAQQQQRSLREDDLLRAALGLPCRNEPAAEAPQPSAAAPASPPRKQRSRRARRTGEEPPPVALMRAGDGSAQVDLLADSPDWSEHLRLPPPESAAAPAQAASTSTGTVSLVPASSSPAMPAWVEGNRWLRCFVPQPPAMHG